MDYKKAAIELWDILDSIDIASDIARSDDKWYRKRVDYLVRQRHAIIKTDGYNLLSPDGDVIDSQEGPTMAFNESNESDPS